jgi:hypothetical protein
MAAPRHSSPVNLARNANVHEMLIRLRDIRMLQRYAHVAQTLTHRVD